MARYRAASRVVAVSRFVEKSLAGSGLPPDRIEVIFVGEVIPPQNSQEDRDRARSRFGLRPENQCLGNAAALVPEKGHVLFLRAFAELRAQFPQSVVLIAGDGPEQVHLQELVRQLHIEDAVKFPGFIPDVESVYAATDLFVFPSHDEPLACAMLSAMARGLPVVAFARGGNPEAIQDGENGLLVKELDSHALANAIARLLLDPAEAQRLGKAARETVSTRFSADRMVDATLRLYEKVISDW
jgi:glycosyltransferase involved in cell wall biosynthesis